MYMLIKARVSSQYKPINISRRHVWFGILDKCIHDAIKSIVFNDKINRDRTKL